jgi:hypothetical protein
VGNYAGYFNGGSDWISVPGAGVLRINGALTLNSWAKYNQFKDYGYIILKTTGGGNIGVNYRMMSQVDRINGLVADGVSSNVVVMLHSVIGIELNSWTMITFVADGSNLKIYSNGQLKGAGTQTLTPAGSSDNMSISASSNGIDGYVDEVQVYNRALSAAEILAIYNATK